MSDDKQPPTYDPFKPDFMGVTSKKVREVIALGYLFLQQSHSMDPELAKVPAYMGNCILQLVGVVVQEADPADLEEAVAYFMGDMLSKMTLHEGDVAVSEGKISLENYYRTQFIMTATLALQGIYGELEPAAITAGRVMGRIQEFKAEMRANIERIWKASQN